MEELPKSAQIPPEAIQAETTTSAPIPYLQFKVALLLALTLVLSVAFVGYVLYARGVFETTQSVVLVSDDSEGISVGMPVTFAGFAIGRVQRIELGDDAKVRIRVTVSQRDAHWLRVSSVFTIEKALVGGTDIFIASHPILKQNQQSVTSRITRRMTANNPHQARKSRR